MPKTNKFYVKNIKKQNITIEEERKQHSPFILFLKKNGKLIFNFSLSFIIDIQHFNIFSY